MYPHPISHSSHLHEVKIVYLTNLSGIDQRLIWEFCICADCRIYILVIIVPELAVLVSVILA